MWLTQAFVIKVGKFGLCSINRHTLIKSSFCTKMTTAKPRIAISQMSTTNDKESNLKQVQQLVSKAKQQNAKVLFLPECCDFVGENRDQTLELSEPLSGRLMKCYKELAKTNSIWLSLGGIHEAIIDEQSGKVNKIYNSHVLLDNDGNIVSIYRKLHLFDVDTPDFRFHESAIVQPGEKLVAPVPTPFGNLGMQICYDVRFGEAALLLRKAGAEILTYPSAFAFSTGKAQHWEVMLRARAIENQCFVIAPAQVGFHNSKRQSWGYAMVINPWGKIECNLGGENPLDIAAVDLDLKSIQTVRNNMPCFEHRRSDVYSLIAWDPPINVCFKDRMFAQNIINKETIFYESMHCFAFTNLCCVVEGHVLVSTKRIVPRLNALTCEEMSDLFSVVNKVQRLLEFVYKTTSATVTVQDGPEAGQTVPHVHFHVMPRRPGDFGHNDQIYVKLEDRVEKKPPRDIKERIEEAQRYRKLLCNANFC